jgi:long-chain acyl-CoA synthetase
VDAFAAIDPDKPVCVTDSGAALSFGDLDARSLQLAQFFDLHGLAEGDVLAILMENRCDYLVAQWAAHRAGLGYVPVNTRLNPSEIDYILQDSRARGMVTSSAMSMQVAQLDYSPVLDVRLSVDGGVEGFDDLYPAISTCPVEPVPGDRAGHDLVYSSGTTGRPKGILTAIGGDLAAVMRSLYGVDESDVYLSPAPMYHTAPARTVFAMSQLGVTTVMMERFDAERFLDLVQRHRVTVTQVVPTMLVRMMKLDEARRRAYDVSSLRCVLHNAAPCPVAVKQQVIEWLGPVLYESYAASEGHGFTYVDSHEWLARPGTVGRAVHGELHICDDDGNELPAGDVGIVYFGGGYEFEYRNEPGKTAESRHARGWSTVGDVGYVDAEGYLFLTDRKSNMIIIGGVNVYPQEAENVLVEHSAVMDAAVFGIPHDDLGEEVKAVVELVPTQTPSDALAAELVEHCRNRLAHVKCPRTIDFTDALPREPNGKLLKRLLRDPFWDRDGAAGADAHTRRI